MITINNLSMGYTGRTLFRDVTFSIFPNEKIGLTGPNGAGKTTLFHLILGNMTPLAGSIQIQKNINIGYLPQESHFKSDRTVIDEIMEGDTRFQTLMNEKWKLEERNKADSARYGDILQKLETLGIYELEHKAERILSGLGFQESDFHKPIIQLSGGWQMRALLAKLLVCPFNLLLLDEPTNYLDLDATLWLKDFLKSYDGAFMLISHDRVILNELTNYTIILEPHQVMKVKGNYEAYEQQKEIDLKSLEKRHKVIEKKRQQLERFTQRFHAQPNRAAAVRNKRKMIDRLEKIDIPQEKRSIGHFDFSQTKDSGYVVVTLDKVSKAYETKQVYSNLDFEIIRGQRVCLVGPNGVGKSTLLKMIAGIIPPNNGEVKCGYNVDIGYFSQTRLDVLHPGRSVFDEVISSAPEGTPAVQVRTLLGLFNFHGDDVFKLVKVLSGGEKSRVILAQLLINPPNFMLLDEPTTHLDVDGVKALTNAFKQYEGTICFISHDLFFIKEVANCIVDIQSSHLKTYPGGLDYYLEKKGHQGVFVNEEKKKIKEEKKKQKEEKNIQKQKESQQLGKLREQHQKAKKRISNIKKEITALRKEEKDLETETYIISRQMSESFGLRDPKTLKDHGRKLKEIQSRLREIESTIKQLNEEKDKISR